MTLFTWLIGKIALSKTILKQESFYFTVAIGYAVSQMLFYLSYLIVHNGYSAFYGVCAVAVAGFIYALKEAISNHTFTLSKESLLLGGFSILLILIIAIPYIYYGVGSYWHTASEDGFDALNAKDYLLGSITSLQDFLPSVSAIERYQSLRGGIENSFIYTNIAIQYSSITFWTIFTGFYHSFDPFILQAVFNFLLMFGGLYILLRHRLGYTIHHALLIAISATGAHLYFGSFINMHEGTMILGAIVPYLLFALFSYQSSAHRSYLIVAIFLTLFLLITYPQPVIFFIAPFVAVMLQSHIQPIIRYIRANKFLLFTLIILSIAIAGYAYLFVQHYMAFSTSRFRSWGISLEPQMLLIYWGLAQSNITNGGTINPHIFSSVVLQTILFIIASIYLALTFLGIRLIIQKFPYFKWFIGFWIVWFVGIRFIIHDSYYFYKLLYVTQFVFILFFLTALLNLIDSQKKWLKTSAYLLLGMFISSNLFFNTLSNATVFKMDYNVHPQKYASILEAPLDILKESYLEVPKQNYKQVIDYYLRQKNIFYVKDLGKAKYIVILKDAAPIYNDIYSAENTVFENNAFKIIKKPTINYLSTEGGWETEIDKSPVGNFKNSSFVWMSNQFKMNFSGKTDKKYLQVCMENGWSVGLKTLKFDIINNHQKSSFLSSGDSCHFIPVTPNEPFEIVLSTDAKGKKLIPFDERELNYRIGFVNFTDTAYSTEQSHFLNPADDVIPSTISYNTENAIVLGNGWYPQEAPHMRWGSNNLGFMVLNATKTKLPISMEIEPGPGVKNLPLRFQILNEENQVVYGNSLSQKDILTFDLNVKSGHKSQTFYLKVLNPIEKLSVDERLLAIKLLNIHTIGQNDK